MRLLRVHISAVLVLAGTLLAPTPVTASEIRADLEGLPIAATSVGKFHCHDLDFPRIHCYSSASALETAVDDAVGSAELPIDGVLAVSYVRIFESASFVGASAYLSQSYSDLRTIGWNDRISSFQALNSLSGRFFEHINYAGFVYSFCCNTQVSYVGDAYNDRFSSVSRP